MPVKISPASTDHMSVERSGPAPEAVTSFEERWTAWQARGVAHERAVRRKVAIAAPILAAVAAVVFYLFAR